MTLKGHFDGKGITLDEAPPESLRPNTPVTVHIESEAANEENPLGQIAAMAVDDDGLPPDYAAQLDHYLYGLPKR